MTFLQLLAKLFCCEGKQESKADVINGARADLNEIGAVFRETIDNYRAHAEQVELKAEEYRQEVKALQEREVIAREAEVSMLRVADESKEMADKIESTLGFGPVVIG